MPVCQTCHEKNKTFAGETTLLTTAPNGERPHLAVRVKALLGSKIMEPSYTIYLVPMFNIMTVIATIVAIEKHEKPT